MKDIEQQIKDQRHLMDVENPPEDVWDGIRDKWKPKSTSASTLWWKVAAGLFLASSIALLVYNQSLRQQVEQLATLGDISEKYREIENDYKLEINKLSQQVGFDEVALNNEYSWIIDELNQLENVNKEYRKDIGNNADQEQLIDALLDYYEKKIRLLKKLELEINRRQNEEINTISSIS